jgi:ribonuclease III
VKQQSNTDRIEKVEQGIGYTFRDKRLLLEALTHKSYYHENRGVAPSYNERLEFLGDSVIGLIIVEYLFLHERSYTEAVLAKIKSYIVSEPVFAEIGASLSLGPCLLLGKGEKSTGGMTKKSILANTFEAVIGALYLDAGLSRTREIVHRLFRERIEAAIGSGDYFDYKTELQEKSQLLYGTLPEYRVIRQQGEEHQRIFTVAVFLLGKQLGAASGRRKKEAETLAAKEALLKMPSSPEVDEVDMDAKVLPPQE